MKDALGNEIILNEYYGYSNNRNGHTSVRVGRVVKLNEKSVTIKVEIAKAAVYNNEVEDDKFLSRDTISVKSNMIFPIHKDYLS